MLVKLNRYGIVLALVAFTGWFIWDIVGAGDTINSGCFGMPQIDHCAGRPFTRPVSACEAIQIHFNQAIHYIGQSHVVTTINGDPADDYFTRGYSGPETAAERVAMTGALASWNQAGCTGPINPNSEFWH